MTDVITFENVSLIFGNRPEHAYNLLAAGKERSEILRETQHVLAMAAVNLTVQAGEILVVMGLSGSGKSSLLRCINGLNGRGGGTGHLRGNVRVQPRLDAPVTDVSRCDSRALRKLRRCGVAMVFQQFGLLPWRTIGDNVGLPLELEGLSRRERDDRVRVQLSLVGLGEWSHRFPADLSGGMQQRVGLARALITDAPILLMDEPFSALDPLIRSEMQQELLRLNERLNRTIVFVSHDFDEAVRIGNRIAVMQDGRIVQLDTPDALVKNPRNALVARFVGTR